MEKRIWNHGTIDALIAQEERQLTVPTKRLYAVEQNTWPSGEQPQEIIETECRAKELVNGKEPWSLWLSRVADWVCLGSTVIIICMLLSVLIFYLFKDREVL